MMRKKLYITPECTIVTLDESTPLLAGSPYSIRDYETGGGIKSEDDDYWDEHPEGGL